MKTLCTVIDRAEIEITIQGKTNLKAMRRAVAAATGVRKVFVKVIGNDPNSASVFSFCIQDPSKYTTVTAALTILGQRFPFATPPRITAIEISLDDYSKGPEQVADWYYRVSKLADGQNRRLYRDFKGSGIAIPRLRDSLVRRIADGYQIGIGNKNADFYQHAYFKQTDHNKQPLPESEHRARIEITLRGNNLPWIALHDWEDCKFEQLAEYFRFRAPKKNLSALEVMALEGIQIGEKATQNRKGGGTRLHNRNTRADPDNERVRAALRNLSRRWKSSPPGRPAKRIACGNSGNVSLAPPNKHKDVEGRSNNYPPTTLGHLERHSDLSLDEPAFVGPSKCN